MLIISFYKILQRERVNYMAKIEKLSDVRREFGLLETWRIIRKGELPYVFKTGERPTDQTPSLLDITLKNPYAERTHSFESGRPATRR